MERTAKPWVWFGVVLFSLALAGCATTGSGPMDGGPTATLSCEGAEKILAYVGPEAEVLSVYCSFKDYKGVKSLHFDVKLKNVSAEPHRYRVNFFLDNGKAVGGLIPRKGKPPVVNPGKEASFTYPVQGMGEKAGVVELLVKTISQ